MQPSKDCPECKTPMQRYTRAPKRVPPYGMSPHQIPVYPSGKPLFEILVDSCDEAHVNPQYTDTCAMYNAFRCVNPECAYNSAPETCCMNCGR
jgi:hypothetical protein